MSGQVIEHGPLRIDTAARFATIHGDPLPLGKKEWDLLVYLASRPNVCVDCNELLREVWHYPVGCVTRTVESHISKLRRKLGADVGPWLQNVWGVGYRFAAPRAEERLTVRGGGGLRSADGGEPFVLDVDEEGRRQSVRAELDPENVFEDSPTAIVLTIGGKTGAGDELQAVTCGPLQFSIDIPAADAVAILKLSEAAAVRDALTRLLEAAV